VVQNYVIGIILVVLLHSTLVLSKLSKKLKQLIAVKLVSSVHGQDGLVAVLLAVVVKHLEPDIINVLVTRKRKPRFATTHAVQNGMTGVNGHHAVKHVVKVNKNDPELMYVPIFLTTSNPELAVSNFLMYHIMNGLLGANALQPVLVVSW